MAQTKITYATMTADRMEDLHRELDRAIEQVKSTFGKSYPLMIGGREVRAAAEFDDTKPHRHADPARHVPAGRPRPTLAAPSPRPKRRFRRGARDRGGIASRC